jgi:hypothetical protein
MSFTPRSLLDVAAPSARRAVGLSPPRRLRNGRPYGALPVQPPEEPPGAVVGAGVPAGPEEEGFGPGVEVRDRPGAGDPVGTGDPEVVPRVGGGGVAVVPGGSPLDDGACVAVVLGVAPEVVVEVGVGVGRVLAGAGRTGCCRSTGVVPAGTGRTMT